jgi:hypothetical protein
MTLRLSLTSLFNVIDLIITVALVSMFGIGIELNPLGVALFSSEYLLLLYKVVIVNICLIILYKFRELKVARVGSWVVFIVYGFLTLYHVVGITVLFIN